MNLLFLDFLNIAYAPVDLSSVGVEICNRKLQRADRIKR